MARKRSTEIPVGHLYVKYKNAEGETSVYLSYFIDGQTISTSTKVKVNAKDWDEVKQKVRTKDRDHERKNNLLAEIKMDVDKRLKDYYDEGNALTAQDVRRILKGEELAKKRAAASGSFLQFAKDENDQRKGKKKGYSTWYNHNLYIKKFGEYLRLVHGIDDIKVREINADYLLGYIDWREKTLRNTSREGINKTLTPLIQAAERASIKGYISSEVAHEMENTYLQKESRQYTGDEEYEEGEIKCLTKEQLKQFVDLYHGVRTETQRYMDLFLFSVYTCGLRVSDLITLEWRHINFGERKLRKNLVKYNKSHEVYLNDAAIAILKKYEAKKTERFVFGLLPASFDMKDSSAFLKKKQSINRTIQNSLNAIGNKLNLGFNLTMHVARHTFAVLALQQGVSLHMISVLMGHSSIVVTEKRYAKFLAEDKDEVVKNLSFNYMPY